MAKRDKKHRIMPLILILLILLSGFSWDVFSHSKIEKTYNTLNIKIYNAEAKMLLGHTVVSSLAGAINNFYSHLAEGKPQETLWLAKTFSAIEEVEQALEVFSNGGVFRKKVYLNISGIEETSMEISYQPQHGQRYNLVALALRPQLLDLKEQLLETKGLPETELFRHGKKIKSLVVRMEESANQLSFEARSKLRDLRIERDALSKDSTKSVVIDALLIFFVISGLIALVFRQSIKTHSALESSITELRITDNELKAKNKLIQDFNTSLEAKIEVRTQALKDEIDERRKIESQLVDNKNELEKAFQELKLSQSKLLQSEKMASVGQLAAGVAHEINNPMGFISQNLKSLKKYVVKLMNIIEAQKNAIKNPSDSTFEELKILEKKLKLDYLIEDTTDLIDESLDGSERVQTIVKNLKTFSRVDQNELQNIDLNNCIDDTINIIWNELKYKVSLEKKYGELPYITCLPQQLGQVFMNLLINASHAIDTKGIIKVCSWADKDKVYTSVSDDGGGISKENLERIFEPFFTTKDVGKGTGLGLSMVYDIIKGHQGEITVESELGTGTTFTIALPIKRT